MDITLKIFTFILYEANKHVMMNLF